MGRVLFDAGTRERPQMRNGASGFICTFSVVVRERGRAKARELKLERGACEPKLAPVRPRSLTLVRFPNQRVRRFPAEALPLLRSVMRSKETFCPSLRPFIPARSTALTWTNTSLLPSTG